jgi:Cu/Ag efflux protein CusF
MLIKHLQLTPRWPKFLSLTLPLIFLGLLVTACGEYSSRPPASKLAPAVANPQSPLTVATHQAIGVVEQLNPENDQVRINHEEIVGYMPAMTMNFRVANRQLLAGLEPGDKVEFVLQYNAGTELITAIKKRPGK